MDFSKFDINMDQEPNMHGSFTCQQDECDETTTEAFLDEGTGKVTYTCPEGHTSDFKMF